MMESLCQRCQYYADNRLLDVMCPRCTVCNGVWIDRVLPDTCQQIALILVMPSGVIEA